MDGTVEGMSEWVDGCSGRTSHSAVTGRDMVYQNTCMTPSMFKTEHGGRGKQADTFATNPAVAMNVHKGQHSMSCCQAGVECNHIHMLHATWRETAHSRSAVGGWCKG